MAILRAHHHGEGKVSNADEMRAMLVEAWKQEALLTTEEFKALPYSVQALVKATFERGALIGYRLAGTRYVPAGWKLVPLEPTVDMVALGWNGSRHEYAGADSARACYRIMLAAAPTPRDSGGRT